jgi:hypothetical protein
MQEEEEAQDMLVDPEPVASFASASIAPIEQELHRRLLAELAEQDVVAIETALLKAFLNGTRAGAFEAVEPIIDRDAGDNGGLFGLPSGMPRHPELAPQPPAPDVDIWARRYGRG